MVEGVIDIVGRHLDDQSDAVRVEFFELGLHGLVGPANAALATPTGSLTLVAPRRVRHRRIPLVGSIAMTDERRKFDEALDATRRTRLANERTYLAWWRTGLTSLAVSL